MAVLDDNLNEFVAAMQRVYRIPTAPSDTSAKTWTPSPAIAGHQGRDLWTDAFGVINLITLSRVTPHNDHYISLAAILVYTLSEILEGSTRDQSSRLPGVCIGKEESGSDGNGPCHRNLLLWMFALNRLSVASGKREYNDMAISLARALHDPALVYQRDSPRPNPVDGYVIFTLLQRTYGEGSTVLRDEISDYEKIVQTKWQNYSSSDPLDLGVTLWSAHWLAGEEEHPWAGELLAKAKRDTSKLFDEGYFGRSLEKRLAFREFGTALGIQCQCEARDGWIDRADRITTMWRDAGVFEGSSVSRANTDHDLVPMTVVMYAAALIPGAFQKSFL